MQPKQVLRRHPPIMSCDRAPPLLSRVPCSRSLKSVDEQLRPEKRPGLRILLVKVAFQGAQYLQRGGRDRQPPFFVAASCGPRPSVRASIGMTPQDLLRLHPFFSAPRDLRAARASAFLALCELVHAARDRLALHCVAEAGSTGAARRMAGAKSLSLSRRASGASLDVKAG